MSTMEEVLEQKLKALWHESREEIFLILQSLEKAASALKASQIAEDMMDLAHTQAHGLKGVLGTHGFEEATRLAHELEMLFARPKSEEGALALEKIKLLRQALSDH